MRTLLTLLAIASVFLGFAVGLQIHLQTVYGLFPWAAHIPFMPVAAGIFGAWIFQVVKQIYESS